MKRIIIISGSLVVLIITVLIVVARINKKRDIANLYVESQRGQFDIVVTTTGELQAKNSTDIEGPNFMMNRRIRVMEITITDLVPEGTEVKEGDYVATLDKTSFDNSLKDELDNLDNMEKELEMMKLDTAVTLSNLRDNIKNLGFSVEEARITVEQSEFEPPTTQRKAEIALDKAIRTLEQSRRAYTLRIEQEKSDIRNLNNDLAEQRQQVNDLEELLTGFTITAPADGMIIYKRDRSGNKVKVGSSINPFDNVVATLPDMSSMISKTYVNEIDISKVETGQEVEVTVDAFPEKLYTGVVTSVANIGEQLPNADAKVFEVIIDVNESDPILKPSMTTGNKIVTKTIDDVIYIPLESVFTGEDSIPYVYLKKGQKQVVVLGESNENNVVIEQGLDAEVQIFLSIPENPERFNVLGEELIAVIREKEKAKEEEERKLREEAEQSRTQRGNMNFSPEMMQQFGGARGGGQMPGGQGGPRDTAMMRRMQEMRSSGQMGGESGMSREFDPSSMPQQGSQQIQQ